MRNKTLFALTLALLLLVMGGFLPGIVGAATDRAITGKMEFAQVSDIQLEFVQGDMAIEETLSIYCKATSAVEVPQDLATRSSQDILLLAQQAFTHYQDAGLVTHSLDPQKDLSSCVSMLHYQPDSSRRSNIFWHLNFEPSDNSWKFTMILDDRTGALCSVHYEYRKAAETMPTSEPSGELPSTDPAESVSAFARLFLNDLGGSFAAVDAETIAAGVSASVDEDFTSTTVSWDDTIKGQCHIVFYLRDGAFYTIYY